MPLFCLDLLKMTVERQETVGVMLTFSTAFAFFATFASQPAFCMFKLASLDIQTLLKKH